VGLELGGVRPLDGSGVTQAFAVPSEHLLTHAVVVGMTGSGKTGLLMVLVEEALRSAIPVIMIDIKGDLPNLLLTFPNGSPEEFAPWMDDGHAQRNGQSREQLAMQEAERWQQRLAEWQLGPSEVSQLRDCIAPRVFTPGLLAGEPLHVLSALEQPSSLWATDVEAARESLSASISLLLRLTGRDPDPTRSRDHVVLSVLAERRLREGRPADVASLLDDVRKPPIERLGAMPIDEFLPKRERLSLATSLNTLLASPTFESWRTGAPLDIASWITPQPEGRTPAVIVSVAHLDDDERALVLGILLNQLLAWVRTLTGTQQLRALLVFDEVYGFVPPHPANPPTKRPIVSLMSRRERLGWASCWRRRIPWTSTIGRSPTPAFGASGGCRRMRIGSAWWRPCATAPARMSMLRGLPVCSSSSRRAGLCCGMCISVRPWCCCSRGRRCVGCAGR
jgi:hypothetical protein